MYYCVTTERYEMKPDCYGGTHFDKHIPQWWGCCEGDKQNDTNTQPLIFDPKKYPPGTKITVEEPICPKCGMFYIDCMARDHMSDNECNFDWKQWAEERYS